MENMEKVVSFEHPDAKRARVDREKMLEERKADSREIAQDQTEDYTLLSKIGEEFASVDSFTLDDINDSYGDYTIGGVLFTEDHLQKYIDEGFLLHNEDTNEYSMTDLGKIEADKIMPYSYDEAA